MRGEIFDEYKNSFKRITVYTNFLFVHVANDYDKNLLLYSPSEIYPDFRKSHKGLLFFLKTVN